MSKTLLLAGSLAVVAVLAAETTKPTIESFTYGPSVVQTGSSFTATLTAVKSEPDYDYDATGTGVGQRSLAWSESDSDSLYWSAIAATSDGQLLYATVGVEGSESGGGGGIYISDNYGQSWSESLAPTPKFWVDIATSSNGQYVYAAIGGNYEVGGIYISSNYGQSWSLSSAPDASTWLSITASSDGQYVYASVYDLGIYMSVDYGQTWSLTSAGASYYWGLIGTSGDGQFTFACSSYNIVASSNYGQNWTTTSATLSYYQDCDIAVSNSGQYVYVTEGVNHFLRSDNYGQNWTVVSAPVGQFLAHVTTSSDGKYVYAAVGGGSEGGISVSTDYGLSLHESTAPSSVVWGGIATSSDGQYVFAVAPQGTSASIDGGGIYTASNYGQFCGVGFGEDEHGVCSRCTTNTYNYGQTRVCAECGSGSETFSYIGVDIVSSTCTSCDPYGASAVVRGLYYNCTLVCVHLPVEYVYLIGFILVGLFVVGHMVGVKRSGSFDIKMSIGVAMYTMVASLSTFSHLVFLLTGVFVNLELLLVAIFIYLIPCFAFLYGLWRERAMCRFPLVAPPSWVYCDNYDSLSKVLFTCLTLAPFLLLNCMFWVPVLLLGFLEYESKLMCLLKFRHHWMKLWTGRDVESEFHYELVHPGTVNRMNLVFVVLQAIPWLIVVAINTTYMNNWNGLVILNMVLSLLAISIALYRMVYVYVYGNTSFLDAPIQFIVFGVMYIDVHTCDDELRKNSEMDSQRRSRFDSTSTIGGGEGSFVGDVRLNPMVSGGSAATATCTISTNGAGADAGTGSGSVSLYEFRALQLKVSTLQDLVYMKLNHTDDCNAL